MYAEKSALPSQESIKCI